MMSESKTSDDDAVVVLEDDKKPAAKRVRWFPIEAKEKINGVGERPIYPFLQHSNLKDSVLVSHLLVERPFLATHGQVSKSWDDVTALVNNEICRVVGTKQLQLNRSFVRIKVLSCSQIPLV
jgi:hypothetical protein